jgi:hypothetical protein
MSERPAVLKKAYAYMRLSAKLHKHGDVSKARQYHDIAERLFAQYRQMKAGEQEAKDQARAAKKAARESRRRANEHEREVRRAKRDREREEKRVQREAARQYRKQNRRRRR